MSKGKKLRERLDGEILREVDVDIPGKEKFKAKVKYRKQHLFRLGEKIDSLLQQSSQQLNKSKNDLEIQFHERFFIAFLNEKGLEVIRGEVFSK